MAITAAQVKELRDKTGIAMMKCKKALEECDGDTEQAIEHLRKQGLETAAKKSGRATNAGGLGVATDDKGGLIVLLACETDFVSGNDQFKEFVDRAAAAGLAAGVTTVAELEQAPMDGRTVADTLTDFIAKIGENMKFEAVARIEGVGCVAYNHGGRVATLVTGTGDAEALRNVAMHVAASQPAPVSLSRDDVPAEVLERERTIIAESPEVAAKPEQIRPKIIDGKLGRFFKESVLLEQEMLLFNDDKQSVADWAKSKGCDVQGFVRLGV